MVRYEAELRHELRMSTFISEDSEMGSLSRIPSQGRERKQLDFLTQEMTVD